MECMTPKRSCRERENDALSNLRLFRIRTRARGVIALAATPVTVERSLQSLIERHPRDLLGVRFLASEHPTGRHHRGRVDTLGLDRLGAPVIIEYKRRLGGNVITQGLFYLDWLVDHRAEFRLLVEERLSDAVAATIDWRAARLICVAAGFSRYDLRAVRHITHTVELVRYRCFGGGILLLETLARQRR